MNKQEAIEIGRANAQMGADENMVERYRENVHCTLIEMSALDYLDDALIAFDAFVFPVDVRARFDV